VLVPQVANPKAELEECPYMIELPAQYGSRLEVDIELDQPATIFAVAHWDGAPSELAVILNGFDEAGNRIETNAFARRDGSSPVSVSYSASEQEVILASRWEVGVVNFTEVQGEPGCLELTITPPEAGAVIAVRQPAEILDAETAPSLVSTPTRTTVYIDSGSLSHWVDTGIDIAASQLVMLSPQGLWIVGSFDGTPREEDASRCDYPTYPAGVGDVNAPGIYFPAPGLPVWCVVGKIGDAPPFLIDGYTEIRPSNSGRLYLELNDDIRADNSGILSVDVAIE
jgi:hypothetical protein